MTDDNRWAQLGRQLEDFYPAPQILFSLIDAVNNPESSIGAVEFLINQEPAFTARILATANSAYYGHTDKIGSIHQAVVLLGFNTILNLTVQLCVQDVFRSDLEVLDFSAEQLWKHSLGVSVACRILARSHDSAFIDEYLTLGILHDVGLLLEARFFKSDFLSILHSVSPDRPGKSFLDLEREHFGHAHPFLTHRFCTHWRIPRVIADPILYHHDHARAPEAIRRRAALLHLADLIVTRSHIGFSLPYLEPNPAPVLNTLGLDLDDFDYLDKLFRQEVELLGPPLNAH